MKLLPQSEQKAYLQNLIHHSGDANFKIQLSELLIKADAETLTMGNLQFAIDNLVGIVEDRTVTPALRFKALNDLLLIYHQNYALEAGIVASAPDMAENRALALRYSQEFPGIKRRVADLLYAQEDLSGAIDLWQEAADEGDYVAILRLYRQHLPGFYNEITRKDLLILETLYTQYLKLAPDYPLGPVALAAFLETQEIEGVLDSKTRSQMSIFLAELWQKNGHDFVADQENAKQWFQQALTQHVSQSVVDALLKIAMQQYQDHPQNLQYLAELYLYGGINDQLATMDYPFERLSELSKAALNAQIIAYQDVRDYGDEKWVMINHQQESDAGNARASFILGENYHYGRYTRQNIEKAIEYYELAGQQGDPAAYNRLGNLFRNDEENVTPDYPRALRYFEKGAALGDSNTAHLAGDMLYFGEGGIEKDYAKAAHYYEMTDLNQGNHHALAKFKQAEILHQGLIAPATKADYVKAITLLLLAAEYGEEQADKALTTWDFTDPDQGESVHQEASNP